MIERTLGPNSTAAELRAGLDASSRAVRGIAHRVADAANPDFRAALEAAGEPPVDIDREMVALADQQLRFEAAAGLLDKVYQQIRASVREG